MSKALNIDLIQQTLSDLEFIQRKYLKLNNKAKIIFNFEINKYFVINKNNKYKTNNKN